MSGNTLRDSIRNVCICDKLEDALILDKIGENCLRMVWPCIIKTWTNMMEAIKKDLKVVNHCNAHNELKGKKRDFLRLIPNFWDKDVVDVDKSLYLDSKVVLHICMIQYLFQLLLTFLSSLCAPQQECQLRL